MADVRLELKRMKTLLGYLVNGLPRVKVGILGGKNQRNKGEVTNAEIGFANEFGKMQGYPKIPARSFIRMPLQTHFGDKLKEKQSLTGDALEQAIESGKAEEFAKKIGLVAEEVIQEAFATRGYGQWAQNAPYTVEQKGSDSPLIDTGQLRRSITSKVIK